MKKIIIYILLVLFSITFLFICFMWFLSNASGHKIPDKINMETYGLLIFNISIISILIFVLKKISKKNR